MLAFFCLGARYRPWRYFAVLHSRVFGDGAAPRRTRCSPQPRQYSVFHASGGGRSPSPAFGAVFCGEGGSYLVRGESKRSSMARSSRMRSRATGSGNILARCVPGRSPMAKCSRNAFPSVRRRQDCALMRSWPDWQWQYSATVRSRAAIRDNFFASCIPKAASDGKIASSWQDSRAMHPKTGWLWQDMRAMHPKSPANRLSGTHGAKILPGRGPFRCTGPSNHAWRADLAVRRSAKPPERPRPRCRRTAQAARARSPGPRNTARRQRPRRLLGSKYRQQLPRYRHCSLPTPASSLSPGEQLCHCRQRHLWRQHPRRHRPADSPSCARPKEGHLPCLRRLSSVLLADAIGL